MPNNGGVRDECVGDNDQIQRLKEGGDLKANEGQGNDRCWSLYADEGKPGE